MKAKIFMVEIIESEKGDGTVRDYIVRGQDGRPQCITQDAADVASFLEGINISD